jgi:plastocyanin
MVKASTTFNITQEPIPPPPPPPPAGFSALLSTDKTSANVNERITWTVTISGGSPPYNVQLRNFNTNETYYSTTTSSTGITGTIAFSREGTFTIYATVTDSTKATAETNRITLTIQSTTQPLSASLSVDKTSTTTDSPVTFTVTISGGRPTYRVQIINSTTNTTISDQFWSSSPATVRVYIQQTGTYTFYAKVIDADNNQATSNTVSVAVSQPSQPLSVSLSASRTSITAGESVSFTITASGGTPNYIAQLRDANTDTVIASTTSFSSSTTVTVRFDTAGTYRIYARVTDSVYTTADSNTVTINVSASTSLSASLSVDKTSVTSGSNIVLTTTISGGRAPYNIKIYMSSSSGRYNNVNIANYDTSQTTTRYTYTLILADTYTFYTRVTDANNNSATTNTVTVRVS